MRDIIKKSFEAIRHDRHLVILTLLLTVLTVVYLVYVFIQVRPSELQLITHYSAFGATHLYRSQWYYLLLFGAFVFVSSSVHFALMVKVLLAKGRELALVIGWSAVLFIAFAWMTSSAIFNVWSPV